MLIVAVPAAIALAWFALRGGRGRRRGDRTALEQTADGGPLEPGATSQLRDPDKPFERHELDYGPRMYGGEIGGPYGPESQQQAPSAPEDGYAEQPAATQTYVAGPDPFSPYVPQGQWEANIATYPTQIPGQPIPVLPDPTQGVIPYGGLIAPPAPAPKPIAGAGRYGGHAAQ